MIAGLVPLIVIVVVVVLAAKKMNQRGPGGVADGHAVRRFFQYLLLYGLLVVVAIGLSSLLGRALQRDTVLVSGSEAELARGLAFTVVGLPLYALLALWSRRKLTTEPDEARSFSWVFYVTVATITALISAMTALSQVLRWAVGLEEYDGRALAQLVVWGGIWAGHWWVGARVTRPEQARLHHLGGSLIGLVVSVTGLVMLLGGSLAALLGLEGGAVLAGEESQILNGAVTLAVGAPVWAVYWLLTTARSERDPLWLAYTLLAGVGGGLVTAVVSASTVVYDVLVWLLGEPRADTATAHFEGVPTAAAAAAVGLLVWWYHHATLERSKAEAEERTEVRRIYEYLMAGIGLLAAAAGLTMVVVALLEALSGSAELVVGQSVVNTLLGAVTLLAVGGPVWWLYWRRIQQATKAEPKPEVASPTRRIYLFVLFGLGGVAAVISLLVGVYILFEDMIEGGLGAETLRSMRFPVGVLLTAGAISAYHWTVFQADRVHHVDVAPHHPQYVLLVGPRDPELAGAVARATGARVESWPRTDDGITPWAVDDVVAAIRTTDESAVVVVSEAGRLEAIPVQRR